MTTASRGSRRRDAYTRVLVCGGVVSTGGPDERCLQTVDVPNEYGTDDLAKSGWLESVISPPGTGELRMIALCLPCARARYPAEFIEEVVKRLKIAEPKDER